MSKMYHVKIFVIEEFTEVERGDWTQVDTEEVERDQSFWPSSGESRTRIKPVYGHTPDRTVKKETEREIFSQVVEELNVRQVISAVNNMDVEESGL